MDIYVAPSDVTAATLRVLPMLTIRPGESLTMRTFSGALNCGNDGYLCRRVIINALPGELIDVEVMPVQDQEVGILQGRVGFFFPSQRQITPNNRVGQQRGLDLRGLADTDCRLSDI